MSSYYPTIQELIDSVNDLEVSYRNLHTNIYIKNKGEIIKIPYKSIIKEYLPFFQSTVVELKLSHAEVIIYRFKPKKLSYDLYGTTELWSALLELNNIYSIIDFDFEKVKVFEPKEFIQLLNEVMILEGIL